MTWGLYHSQLLAFGQRELAMKNFVAFLGVIGVLIGAYAAYDQLVVAPRKETVYREETKRVLYEQAQERRFADLSHTYEDRLNRATVDNEAEAAGGALREIAALSSHFQNHPDPLRHWVSEREMTQPQFVHVLYETDMVSRKLTVLSSPERLTQRILWQVSNKGRRAIKSGDFVGLRKTMEDSLRRATGYGLSLSHILYGRYWGVALVTESSYEGCDAWEYDEPQEVDREPPLIGLLPPDTDDRIFGRVRVRMIAGAAWHGPKSPREQGEPIRVGQSVDLVSEHGSWNPQKTMPGCKLSNITFIRGCPKVGDLVAYLEGKCAEQWENLGSAELK
jgi:hypothetical protein